MLPFFYFFSGPTCGNANYRSTRIYCIWHTSLAAVLQPNNAAEER